MKNKHILIWSVVSIIIVLDQLTKFFASSLTNAIQIIPKVVSFNLTTNTGAGFGIFSGYNAILLFLSLIILGAILYYYDKIPDKKYIYVSVALIIGGAIGNIIDRIAHGRVIDFIDFAYWPAFNVADSAITIGAILVVIYYFKN